MIIGDGGCGGAYDAYDDVDDSAYDDVDDDDDIPTESPTFDPQRCEHGCPSSAQRSRQRLCQVDPASMATDVRD